MHYISSDENMAELVKLVKTAIVMLRWQWLTT